jgi:hypothetical protein
MRRLTAQNVALSEWNVWPIAGLLPRPVFRTSGSDQELECFSPHHVFLFCPYKLCKSTDHMHNFNPLLFNDEYESRLFFTD